MQFLCLGQTRISLVVNDTGDILKGPDWYEETEEADAKDATQVLKVREAKSGDGGREVINGEDAERKDCYR